MEGNIFNRWNNTDLQPNGTGPVKFCDDLSQVDCHMNKTLQWVLTTIIQKYVFFSTDKRYLDSFTDHEEYIIKKYAADLPKLMFKV